MIHLIFPHQLFYNKSHLKNIKDYKIYLIEEPRYFTDYKFHKLKLAYHRASMKKYFDTLHKAKYNITYVDFDKVDNLYKSIKGKQVSFINPIDFKLVNKLNRLLGKKNIAILENINFLIKSNELDIVKSKIYKNKKYNHDEFYKYQRIKLNILIDNNNKPIGGKWSYDKENRLPLPKGHKVPKTINRITKNKYITEAIKYVNDYFGYNYGSLDNFIYPLDNKGAKKWLNKFLKQRLVNFGAYEDAVSQNEPFVYHSILAPMMNIGIITDEEVVSISNKYYLNHKKSISIQSYEGFIRQVIGWRNYVYTVYQLEGEKMYEQNYLKHNNKINEKFWLGTTGIKPIDFLIKKINEYSYVHHIERLMYLGNFMLLCLINPKDVHKIFMEWTIDAYDWVMVPNVFGMSQYTDGGTMMTRPYFSSSNYIHNMSTFKRDGEWDKVWDALYYNFIDKHYDILKRNYATAQQVKHWDNKSNKDKDEIKKIAKRYLKELF